MKAVLVVLSIASAMVWTLLRARHYSVATALASAGADVGLFVGTHTGMSLEYAKRLDRELKWRLGVKTLVAGCDDYDFGTINNIPPSKTLLFFITSYGFGEPTKNAVNMWHKLFSMDKLDHLDYSVLGRGSSAYGTFNKAGQDLDAQLAKLGGNRAAAYHQTDRLAVSNEEAFFDWKEAVIAHVKAKLQLKEAPFVYTPSTDVKESPPKTQWSQTPSELLAALALNCPEKAAPEYAEVQVKSASSDESGRQLVHCEFDLSRTGQVYESGDYLTVWPSNSEIEVSRFLQTFGLDRNQVVTIDNKWRSTYGQLAERFIDVNAQLSREVLKYFIAFAPSPEAAQKLESIVGSHNEFEQFSKAHFNIGRALLACSDQVWKVPSSLLLDVLPRLKPRDYSISSSPEYDSTKVSIGLVVEQLGEWNGVASNYLLDTTDSRVPVSTELSSFKLPISASTPIIMIGVGTGVSPYRGFVQERQSLRDAGVEVGPTALFGGFRSRQSFQYHDFFESSSVVDVHTAYSRPGPEGRYVQDALVEQQEEVYDLINQGAHIYICGSARIIGLHIRHALITIIARNAGISHEAATLQFKVLKKHGRVHQDMW